LLKEYLVRIILVTSVVLRLLGRVLDETQHASVCGTLVAVSMENAQILRGGMILSDLQGHWLILT